MEVITHTTPWLNRLSNSLLRIIASAISVTCASHQHAARSEPRPHARTHLELVKTQDTRLVRQIPRHGANRVAALVAHRGLGGVEALVHVDHERVEVHAALAGDGGREGVVEEVHEHGLAGADVAVEVQAARGG